MVHDGTGPITATSIAVQLRDAGGGITAEIPLPQPISDLASRPGGGAVVALADATLVALDRQGQVVATIDHRVESLWSRPDGDRIVALGDGDYVTLDGRLVD